jgi:hypothetical protein
LEDQLEQRQQQWQGLEAAAEQPQQTQQPAVQPSTLQQAAPLQGNGQLPDERQQQPVDGQQQQEQQQQQGLEQPSSQPGGAALPLLRTLSAELCAELALLYQSVPSMPGRTRVVHSALTHLSHLTASASKLGLQWLEGGASGEAVVVALDASEVAASQPLQANPVGLVWHID